METVKNILWAVLKYVLILAAVLVLTGYLSVKGKLPAMVPEPMAREMKELTLRLLRGPETAPVQTAERGVVVRQSRSLSAAPSIGYRILDTLFLDRRAAGIASAAVLNNRRTGDALAESERLLEAIAASDFSREFFLEPRKPEREFPLRAYLDKFLFDSSLLTGYEIFDGQGRLIHPGRYEFPVPSARPASDASGLLHAYPAEGKVYAAVKKEVIIRSRTVGSIRLIYDGSFFDFFSLPGRFPAGVVLGHAGGGVLHAHSSGVDSGVLLRLESLRVRSPKAVRLTDQGRSWRVHVVDAGAGLSAAYYHLTVPVWKIVLNAALYLCGILLLLLLVRLTAAIVSWSRRMTAVEGGGKDEVVTGAISEVVKTLKNTAELTERMTESSREDLAYLRQTVERAKSPRSVRPSEPAAVSGEEDSWDVMTK